MLQLLQNDMTSHQKNYSYVYKTAQQLLDKCAAGSDIDKLRSLFDSLQRWSELVDAVNRRVDQCRSTIQQLKQYQVCWI